MKKISAFTAAVLLSAAAMAQTTSEDFLAKYNKQVRNVGPAGVGVEFILDKWEEAFPEDGDMLEARFNYCYSKSQRTEVIKLAQNRYLGAKPVVSIPDSTGTSVNFFEDIIFDDEMFATSQQYIDKAAKLHPADLAYRFDKISALIAYEKESPDLASSELMKLIDQHNTAHPAWLYRGEAVDEEFFFSAIQEFCYTYYTIGSQSSYEFFRTVSEKMNKLYPKETVYLTNLGSYYLVARNLPKKAVSYYKKALKLDPENAIALRNMKVAEKKMGSKK